VRLDVAGLVRRISNDPLELGVSSELLKVRAGNRMAEKGLGEEDNESYGPEVSK
jgi:hypothetical protein